MHDKKEIIISALIKLSGFQILYVNHNFQFPY